MINSLHSDTVTSRQYQTDGDYRTIQSACTTNGNPATNPILARRPDATKRSPGYDNVSPRGGGFYLPGAPMFPNRLQIKTAL